MGWGRYTPVLAELDNGSTQAAATRIQIGYDRVWVILVWRGFATVNEDARPVSAVLADDYQELASRRFGPSLRVILYQRIAPVNR
jgi:hypothetical protein